MMEYRREESIPDKILDLYEDNFHGIERVPKEGLLRAMESGGKLYTYYDGDFVGFTYQFALDDMIMLVYFATEPEKRNRGYGAQILDIFREINPGQRLFVILETCDEGTDNYEMRVRRRNFYLRNGCFPGPRILWDDWFDILFIRGELTEDEIYTVANAFEDLYTV